MKALGLSPRRWIPRMSYHRYDGVARACFTQWFGVDRRWGGRLVYIRVKHHQVTLDFRGDWLHDMAHGRVEHMDGGAA